MSFSEDRYQLFDRFLSNELTNIEKEQFNNELESNKEFKSEFESFQLASKAVVIKELQNLDQALSNLDWNNLGEEPTKKKWNWKFLLLFSLTCAIGLSVISLKIDNSKSHVVKHKPRSIDDVEPVVNWTGNSNSVEKVIIVPENAQMNTQDPANTFIKPDSNQSFIIISKEANDIPEARPKKSESVVAIKQNTNCENIHLSADLQLNGSCPNQKTGSIIFGTVQGGLPPYYLEFDKEKYENLIIQNLPPDNYVITLKDQLGCLKTFSFTIPQKDCLDEKSSSLNATLGESLEFGLQDKAGVIELFNSSGTLITSIIFEEGDFPIWDATDDYGAIQNPGVYFYKILSDENIIEQGEITVF